MNNCKKCGAKIPNGAKFCNECGAKIETEKSHLTSADRESITLKRTPTFKDSENTTTKSSLTMLRKENVAAKKRYDMSALTKTQAIIIVLASMLLMLAIALAIAIPAANKTKKRNEETNSAEDNTMDNSIDLATQFIEIGFTQTEAESLVDKFTTMGLTDVSNIEASVGDGIDGLQSFRAKIFDYDTLTLQFTIENRQLCYVSVNGFPAEKVDFYINFFGKLKYKIVNSKKSIIFYDIWDENGEIIEDAVGYKAVWDRESNTIKEYTE